MQPACPGRDGHGRLAGTGSVAGAGQVAGAPAGRVTEAVEVGDRGAPVILYDQGGLPSRTVPTRDGTV